MHRSTAAQIRRVEMKAEVSRLFKLAMARHNVTEREFAEHIGVQKSIVNKKADVENKSNDLSAIDLMLGHPDVVRDLLVTIAGHHGLAVVDAPEAAPVTNDLHHLAEVIAETSDVAKEYAAACADGNIDPEEAGRIEREAMEGYTALYALAIRAQEARKARGELLRREVVVG